MVGRGEHEVVRVTVIPDLIGVMGNKGRIYFVSPYLPASLEGAHDELIPGR